MRFQFRVSLVVLLAGLLAFAVVGSAQVTSATIYGTVTDSSGAVIPGVTVTLTHEATGGVITKESSASGDFVFDFLRVGAYTMAIEAEGFKKYEGTGMELVAGQTIRQTYVLEVGSITETVEVTSAAPLVQTSAAEQMQTFSTKRVTELPLARRNFTNLLKIGTGVSQVGGGSGAGVRMNGMGRNGTQFAVDGGNSNSNPEGNSAGGYQGVNYIDIMSIEGVQEVQTVKGIVPAEYGSLVGGQVQIITKSGTNDWHGAGFENFQAEELNARDPELKSKSALTYNQFGGSIGGAIKKDKIFIFADYEGYRERSLRTVRGDVPTPKHRARLLQAQPTYSLVLDVFPEPNQPFDPNEPCLPASETMGQGDLLDGCNAEFLSTGSSKREDNHVDIKGDIRLNDVSNLSLTYIRGRPFRGRPAIHLDGANDRDWVTESERGTASFTTGGADWTSETRFTYNLNDMFRLDKFFLKQVPGGPEEVLEFDNRVPRLSPAGVGWGGPGAEIFLLEGYVWNLSEKFSKHVGNHSFKFGGGYTRHCCIRTNPENNVVRFQTYDELLNDTPSSVRPTFGSGKFKGRMYEFNLFVQDDWRVNDKLVLNIGLRYDFFSNMVAKARGNSPLQTGFFNADGLLDDQFTFGPVRDIEDPYNNDAVNIGPRFGFAYRLDEAGDTVIRGGVGVLFSPQMPGMAWQSVNLDLGVPFRTQFSRAQVAELGFNFNTPNRTLREFVAQDFLVNQNVNTFSYFDPDLENPYAIHWNFGIQHRLGKDLMLETAYVANRGVKFPLHRRANQVIRTGPRAGIRPNPKLNLSGYYVDASQTTKYHSWQTSLRKRYSQNLSFSLHYTYSKALSTGSQGDVGAYYQGDNNGNRVQDFFDTRREWGPSSGDVTHYFASDWVLDLPRFAGMSGAARNILGGWQVSGVFTANSGGAFTIGQSASGPPARPDYIGGKAILNQGKQYLNPAAFALVPRDPVSRAAIRPGNVGNGFLRNTARWNLDFSFGKNFQVTEQVKLRWRFDMFNALNTIFKNGLRTNLSRSKFGEFRRLSGPRTVQMNLRLTF